MPELDVAGVVDPLQELLHRFVVARLGRADEVVVGDVERVPLVAEHTGDRRARAPAGSTPLRLGRALDLQAVLVGAGEEARPRRRSSRCQRVSTSPATVV